MENRPAKLFGRGFQPQIIEAMNDVLNAPTNLSNGKYRPDTCLLDTESYTHIATTPRSTQVDTTILKFLQIAHPNVTFDIAPLCKGAGYNGADVVFVYNRNPLHIALGVEHDFEQLPPFDDGAVINVKCHERFSGVLVYRPLRCCIGEQPVA